ncbi:hypothetical protein BH09ACT3_BH09ACT3_08000 [soil metagenome]
MSGDGGPFIISGPPGGIPAKPAPGDPAVPSAAPEDFIALPPGLDTVSIDSGTYERRTPRVVRDVPQPVDGDIVFFPVAPGAPPVPAPDSGVDDSTTMMPARTAERVWRLILPGGDQVVPVTGAIYLGRDPRDSLGRPDASLLPAHDPGRSLSKTHALIEVEGGKLWVHDLNSTNGVFVAPPGVEAIEVEPGTRVEVPNGADLELGEYVIQVRLG